MITITRDQLSIICAAFHKWFRVADCKGDAAMYVAIASLDDEIYPLAMSDAFKEAGVKVVGCDEGEMKRVLIQEEVSVTQEEVDEAIKRYERVPDTWGMGIHGKMLDKQGIIDEIKKLSDVGKAILLMDYKFEKWKNERR